MHIKWTINWSGHYKWPGLLLFFLLVPSIVSALSLEIGDYQFEALNQSKTVYVMHGPLGEPNEKNKGFINNPAFVMSKNGVIVIDPGSSQWVGQQVIEDIKKISKKPILAIFNTHIHGDHWLANHALKQTYPKANIYAHPNMIKQAGEHGQQWLDIMARMTKDGGEGTQIVLPNHAIKDGDIIEIDDQHFKIRAVIPAHTNTDIMIEHVESKTLFLGDNCFSHRLGRFDHSASMLGNIKALELAMQMKMKHYVPGHGPSGDANQVVKPYLNYLHEVKNHVEKGMENDLADFEIKEQALPEFIDYLNWVDFDRNFGRHINSLYLELEKNDW